VVELVYTSDLKSDGASHPGSNPGGAITGDVMKIETAYHLAMVVADQIATINTNLTFYGDHVPAEDQDVYRRMEIQLIDMIRRHRTFIELSQEDPYQSKIYSDIIQDRLSRACAL
jgi:hypothetical protein